MQSNTENDGTMLITARELLTVADCEQIIRADGCLVGYKWPEAQKPSPTMLHHVRNFSATIKLTALIYDSMPDERQWMCNGLLHLVQEIANEGFLTKFSIYRTEEGKQGCVIAFWPIHLLHDNQFRVPRRLDDLVQQNFVRRKAG